MKKSILVLVLVLSCLELFSQTFTTNDTPVGMEHNLLFNAQSRFQVLPQTGTAKLNINYLFDGRLGPSYTDTAPTVADPTVIVIENLPAWHTQIGAWVGWSTRYWPAKKFKIEGYNTYENANTWVTFADVSDHPDYIRNFTVKTVPGGAYSKLRFTFYEASGKNGRLGVSELFFIHPEATTPYQGLLETSGPWKTNANGVYYNNGKVGIGTSDTKGYELAVNGRVRSKEVKVETSNWPDYVFRHDYNLPTLEDVENHINKKGHLKDIPSEEEVKEKGIYLGEMNSKLLQKIEELTLYIICQHKEMKKMKEEIELLKKEVKN